MFLDFSHGFEMMIPSDLRAASPATRKDNDPATDVGCGGMQCMFVWKNVSFADTSEKSISFSAIGSK